ncbi:MAG: hypothetical protein IKC92_01360 [Tidjanibacter sp.]|nr:hypothetical protein [Tidjanibacter sp.]
MKKLLLTISLLLSTLTINAQTEVTKFLGIPIDGTKPEMIRKLKAKGFTESPLNQYLGEDVLEGEFNGYDVTVYVGTNKNKVYRIMLLDNVYLSESQIKTRFNILVNQFENNENYYNSTDYTIPEDEDISYEMLVNNKRYEALFYQYKKPTDDEITEDMSLYEYTSLLDNKRAESLNRCVWFRIVQQGSRYCICMYYDNELNKANGEDL